ncbi:MAG: prephenate dehydrogenase [Bacilli bacterium]|nr:prephenate dehydrogenase [Bacilli bacterium]
MNIGIVGIGLIGGTYAKALRKYPYNIYGIDNNEETLAYAIKENIVDYAYTNPKSVLKELDVVFICLYPEDTIKFVRDNINHFKRGAIISDVVGVKRTIIDNLEVYFEDDVEFVFAHPIAGREKIGITYAQEEIFKDANFVITPTKKNTDEAINLISTLAKQMGFKNVSIITDTQHDEIISFTSQLTHVLALALVNSDDEKFDTSLFIGDSYKDLTRIAMINEKLWSELFIKNKDHLIRTINRFEKHLDEIKDAISKKDKDHLEELMVKATTRRGRIK